MLSATVGFVAGQNSIFGPLFGASTDGGVTWNFQSFLFDNNEGGCTDVFFFDQTTGVTSGAVFDGRGAIARTTDAGLSWSTLFFDQSIQGIDFAHPISGFAVGGGGRISHSTDAGISWTDQTSGTFANLNDVSFANDALRGIVVGDGGTILWTADGGEPTPQSNAYSDSATSTPSSTPTPTASSTPSSTPTSTAYTNGYRDSHTDTYCYSDGHGDSYSNAATDAYAEECTDAEASSDTASSPHPFSIIALRRQ